jgi:hypothetical protein
VLPFSNAENRGVLSFSVGCTRFSSFDILTSPLDFLNEACRLKKGSRRESGMRRATEVREVRVGAKPWPREKKIKAPRIDLEGFVACDACHSRKTRCSGAPFPCTFCSSRNIECIVSDPPSRRRDRPSQSQDASSNASTATASAGLDPGPTASTSYQADLTYELSNTSQIPRPVEHHVLHRHRKSFSGPLQQPSDQQFYFLNSTPHGIANIPFSP